MARWLAVLPDVDAAQAALARLEAQLAPDSLEVLSSIPLPAEALGMAHRSTRWQAYLSAVMGVVGALAGFLLAGGTAWLYPLPTGGKPIIAMPAVGVVMYEMTMLAAIWTAFFVALGLVFRRRDLPVLSPEHPGAVGLVVETTRHEELVRRALGPGVEVRACE